VHDRAAAAAARRVVRPAVDAPAGAVCRAHADCGRDARCCDDRARQDGGSDCHRAAAVGRRRIVDCIAAVAERRPSRSFRSQERRAENWIRSSWAPRTRARVWRETEVLVMSYCRAHRESLRHRVLVLRDPLAPDTDRRHRRIREKVVGCRTDGCAGRDEKDVGVVHSCICGVAEKKIAARMAHGDRGKNSREIRNLILFGMARLAELRSCKNGTMDRR